MEKRQCTKCKCDFMLDANDFSFYEKMKVPAPTVCPDCRFKMRAVWRNEMSLYTGRKCGLCGVSVLSMYHPESPYVVYCNSCYRGDGWNPASYGVPYDYSRPFFEQLAELFLRVPKNALYSTTGAGPTIASEYTNCVGGLKNCYFLFNSSTVEDSLYSRGVTYSTEVTDCYFGIKLDQCYECVNVQQSSHTTYAKSSTGCVDCHFIDSCSGCTECFGCVNLRNKKNCFLNQQLSKQEYDERVSEIRGSYEETQKFLRAFNALCLTEPHRESQNIKVLESVGDYLSECKHVEHSFEIIQAEDSKWNFSSREFKDCYGTVGYGIKSERMLEVASTGYATSAIGCWACELSQDIAYCISCFPNNTQLLGCDSMRNEEYCILNMSYTKEEYIKLKEHIVRELTDLGLYGLMLPPELSPFGYNETVANDNAPMTREQALAQGFAWQDSMQQTRGKETLMPENISDHIRDVDDSITQQILCCVDCKRNYKIIDAELLFYRKMALPIPRQCFYCRHQDRIRRRGPYQFWERECALCHKHITTTYAPDRPEIVYCEACYQKEVI